MVHQEERGEVELEGGCGADAPVSPGVLVGYGGPLGARRRKLDLIWKNIKKSDDTELTIKSVATGLKDYKRRKKNAYPQLSPTNPR